MEKLNDSNNMGANKSVKVLCLWWNKGQNHRRNYQHRDKEVGIFGMQNEQRQTPSSCSQDVCGSYADRFLSLARFLTTDEQQ